MRGNRGATTLRSRLRRGDPMGEFDRLPAPLRAWLAEAVLPWRPRSALTAFQRAMKRTRDEAVALQELDALQTRLIARDAARIWGETHPSAEATGQT